MAKRELSDSAMDAVFDSFVGSPLSIVADRCVGFGQVVLARSNRHFWGVFFFHAVLLLWS